MKPSRSLKRVLRSSLFILIVLVFFYVVLYIYDFMDRNSSISSETYISNLDSDKRPFLSNNNNEENPSPTSTFVDNQPEVSSVPNPTTNSSHNQEENDFIFNTNASNLEADAPSSELTYDSKPELKPEVLNANASVYSSISISNQDIINRFWTIVRNSKAYNVSSEISIPFQSPFTRDQLSSLNLWQSNYSSALSEEDRILAQLVFQSDFPNSSLAKTIKPKLILAWGGYHLWWKSYWQNSSTGDKYILSLKEECPSIPDSIGGCIFTENNSLIHEADAILMQGDTYFSNTILKIIQAKDFLKFTYILESPYHSKPITLTDNNHMLATYWSGSQMANPYFKWVYFNPNVKAKSQGRDYSKGKSKPGAMFVSNCMPKNNRMGYISELQKYIQVDLYGLCGTMSCSRNSEICPELLKKDYYFYFAFENSNCRDYITEKFFINAFENDVVPIVMGAHPQDYRAMAPFHSYIHVEDFKSPQALADHLKFLISNPSEYNRYFEWKGTGTFVSGEFFCRLCALSHYADIVPPPKIFTKPFEWRPESQVTSRNVSSTMCLNYGNWYWTLDN